MSNYIRDKVQKIFEAKKEYHRVKSELPIEKKIKMLVELQIIGKKANPEMTKNKRVWKL